MFNSAYKPLWIIAVLLFCPGIVCSLGVLSGTNFGQGISLVSLCLAPICLLAAIWYGIRYYGK
jgi:hypothetical protein